MELLLVLLDLPGVDEEKLPRTVEIPSKWAVIRGSDIFFVITIKLPIFHYSYVIMGAMASQITSLTIVYSTVYSGAHQRKHQGSMSLAFVGGIHRWPVNFPHKGSVTRKMFPSCLWSVCPGMGSLFHIQRCISDNVIYAIWTEYRKTSMVAEQ